MIQFMNYPGGKGKVYQHVINLIPPHSVYIETHLGGGAVLRNKNTAQTNIGIEIDGRVIQWWEDHYPDLAKYVQRDAVQFLKEYEFNGTELIYCDPPYVKSARLRKRVYRYDYDDDDHHRLLDALCAIPCSVIISGYPCRLYEDRLRTWNSTSFRAKTHAGVRVEKLWFNFPVPARLHDYRYLGQNFRERECIKRRMDRLRKRVSSLTKQEQHELATWLSQQLAEEAERAIFHVQ